MLSGETLEHIAEYFGVTREEERRFWQKLIQRVPDSNSVNGHIANVGASLFRVLAVISLIAGKETVTSEAVDETISYIAERLIRRLNAVAALEPEENDYVKSNLDLFAGLTFVEQTLDWCVWVYRSESTKVAPLSMHVDSNKELVGVEYKINYSKLGVSNDCTYLRVEDEGFSSVVRECIAAYGLYINSHIHSASGLELRTKRASEYLSNSVVSSLIGIGVNDINVPRKGLVKKYSDYLDRCLFDSFVFHLEKNTLGNWLSTIASSPFFNALDEAVESGDESEVLQSVDLPPISEHGSVDTKPTFEAQDNLEVGSKHTRDYELSDEEVSRTFLMTSEFRWPSTVAFEADGSLPEVEWPQIGVLKAVGYTVGAQGLPQSARLSILKHVYSESLPFVFSHAHMKEWGEPQSSTRLKKMAEALASFARGAKRKTLVNMDKAVSDWEHDLAWLKEEYYLKHKYVWVWPSSKNTKVSDKVSVVQEKQYQSSRDFLVEQYTNNANELCCQVCQSALPFKLESGEYFWEETRVTESIQSSPYSDLLLCPNHRAMYLHANSKPNQLLENLGDSFSKKLSIELASEQVSIFVTELHQKKLRLAKELMSRTKASSCLFDFSNIPQGLQGVKRLYLYENQGSWVVSSRAKVIATLTSKSEAKKWLTGFDEHRGVISTITEKVPTPKSKKTKQPKLKAGSSLSVAGVRFGTVKKTEPQSSYKTGFTTCSNCHGDGGINGGCWKCGGSGWM